MGEKITAGYDNFIIAIRTNKKTSEFSKVFGGATDGIRTHDLTITNRLLYQLSYGGAQAGEIIQHPRKICKKGRFALGN